SVMLWVCANTFTDSITELLLHCKYVDWTNVDINESTSRLDYIKAVLSTTNATEDIGNMIIC
ncbi:MAG: hypothetical protein ACKPKO_45315, partial [Candidatus Fonsibacter sp.]